METHRIQQGKFFACFLLLLLIPFSGTGAAAQTAESDETIVIAFAPQYPMPELLTENFFRPFEDQYPNVDVVVVDPPDFPFMGMDDDHDFIGHMASYAGIADVFAVGSSTLTPVETRAGLVLDLQPFIDADDQLAVEDTFYPLVQDAYEWDDGNWALPSSWSLALMGYHRSTFEESGLPYPHPLWSWETFVDTMSALEEEIGSSPVADPYRFGLPYAVLSLANVSLADANAMPQFDNEILLNAWEEWDAAQQDSWIVSKEDYEYDDNYPVLLAPFHLSRSGFEYEYVHTTLPGGRTVLDAQGFAVSSGTTHPEISYALTKYLTRQLEYIVGYSSNLPARIDIYDQSDDLVWFVDLDIVRKNLEKLLPEAFHPSELLYSRYLGPYHWDEEEIDIKQRLLDAQQKVLDDLKAAEDYDAQITIEKPLSDHAPVHGDTIRFGVIRGFWTRGEKPLKDFAAEYAREHPDIGRINLQSRNDSPNYLVDDFDCFYGSDRDLAEMPISSLSRLEPLVNTDANFELDNFIPAALDTALYQDVLWGIPISLHPLALRYDPAALDAIDLASLSSDWDAADFDRILRSLAEANEDSEELFGTGNTYGSDTLQMLIAAYGGLPIDYRVDPTAYDLTSPDVVEAIRQVLDLARDEIMEYHALGGNGYTFGSLDQPAMISDTLGEPLDRKFADYELINFPLNDEQALLSHTAGLGFINAETPHQQACYDWISALSQRPDLFNGLPARTNLTDSEAVLTAVAPNGPAFFDDYIALLNRENSIIFPERDHWYDGNRWLHQAFDSYVLEDMPLEESLAIAVEKQEQFRECVGDSSSFRLYECAEKIDRQSED